MGAGERDVRGSEVSDGEVERGNAFGEIVGWLRNQTTLLGGRWSENGGLGFRSIHRANCGRISQQRHGSGLNPARGAPDVSGGCECIQYDGRLPAPAARPVEMPRSQAIRIHTGITMDE